MSSANTSKGTAYPPNPTLGEELQGSLRGTRNVGLGFIAHLALTALEAAVASATGVHAAVTDTGVLQTVTTSITNPPYSRNITATAGGTSGDIKAVQVVIEGTNEAGAYITETLPVFTENTAGIVTGSKCFRTVTSITIPAHDGTGATTAIGFGSKLGLPHKLSRNTLFMAFFGNVEEITAPTVTVSSSAIESNGVTLDTTLAASAVDLYYLVA